MLSLNHIFTVYTDSGAQDMRGRKVAETFGYGAFSRDEVEHSGSCWCKPVDNSEPPF